MLWCRTLTDFLTKTPKNIPDAKKIDVVEEVNPKIEKLASGASAGGRGGMVTKLSAAKVVNLSGLYAMIVNGKKPRIIKRIFEEENVGTIFLPNKILSHKKRWIAYATNIMGEITVNAGAKSALIDKQKSLLAVGITGVKGDFKAGEIVSIFDEEGGEFARAMVNYSSDECRKIMGAHSHEIEKILGYKGDDDVVIKDNLVIL